jgi:PAS domain S-box-containing protein
MAKGEAPYRQVVENALEGVWVIDAENRTTYVNRRMAEMLGRTVDEMLGTSILDYRKAEDREETQKSVERCRSGAAETKESEILRKDGACLPVLVATTPLSGAGGEYLGAVALVTDISELRKAQDALRDSRDELEARVQERTQELESSLDAARDGETRWRALVQSASDVIATIGRDGKVLFINRVSPPDTPDTVIGESVYEWLPPEEHAKLREVLEKVFERGELQLYESQAWGARETPRTYENRVGPVKIDGNIDAALFISTDITDRKIAEDALRVSEERFRTAFEQGPMGMAVTDMAGRFLGANAKFHEILGYDSEELAGLTYRDFTHPDNLRQDIGNFAKLDAGEIPVYRTEKRYIRKDGQEVWGQTTVSLLHDADGKAAHHLVMLDDISARRLLEAAIRDSEQKYRALVEYASEGILLTSPDGRIFTANPAARRMFGRTEEELIRLGRAAVMDSSDPRLGAALAERARTGRFSGELTGLRRDGTRFPVQLSSSVFRNAQGEDRTVSIISDLTARKDQSELLEAIFEKSIIGILLFDLKGRLIRNNRAARDFAGWSGEEMKRMTYYSNDYPDDLDKDRLVFKQLSEGKRDFSVMEKRIIRKDGTVRWGRFTLSALKAGEGRPRYILSMVEDITGRKKAELAMRRALMRFELDEGRLYLVKEESPQVALEAFRDLLRAGYEGVLITRTPGEGPAMLAEHPFTLLWLSAKAREGSIPPDLEAIERWAEELAPGKAILLEGLDHLVTRHGFNKTMLTVHRLKEIAFLNNHIIMLTVDPATLGARQVRLLEKEGLEVRPIIQESLSEDLLETLRYIYGRNIVGVRPTMAAVGRGMKLSKPTVRKRLHELLHRGFVISHARGSGKTLELTEKGRMLFLR